MNKSLFTIKNGFQKWNKTSVWTGFINDIGEILLSVHLYWSQDPLFAQTFSRKVWMFWSLKNIIIYSKYHVSKWIINPILRMNNIQAIFEAKKTWIWYKNCLNCAAIMDIPIVFVSTTLFNRIVMNLYKNISYSLCTATPMWIWRIR